LPSRHGSAYVRADPVLAAGIGVRHGRNWPVRSASFRIGPPEPGSSVLGILIDYPAQAAALVDVLAGATRPGYGELRVLGHDMATIRGRAAVRHRVGVARRASRQLSGMRIRRLVEHGARLASHNRSDRRLLAAAILDRLSLLPWADVPVRAAPDAIARRARLAAAAVHQPDLLLLDALLDGLPLRHVTALADAVRDLSRDSGVLLAGCDREALLLACDDVLLLSNGVLVSA
jgi:ABC-2 type transport system ATP-binding protein